MSGISGSECVISRSEITADTPGTGSTLTQGLVGRGGPPGDRVTLLLLEGRLWLLNRG